ncbi:MAG: hypothetical protein ACI9EF_000820 [Pseudohongiellaceae bacterium]|jgi:hypothetical protein
MASAPRWSQIEATYRSRISGFVEDSATQCWRYRGVLGARHFTHRLLGLQARKWRRREIDDQVLSAMQRAEVPFAPYGSANSQLTGNTGQFHFSGLPEGWEGWILFPRDYDSSEGERRQLIDSPGGNLEIALIRCALVTGAVINAGGIPASGAAVHATIISNKSSLTKGGRNSRHEWQV